MANNYQQFSTVIPYATVEQRDWLLEELAKEDEETECPFNTFEDTRDGIWVYAEESGDIAALAGTVAEYQEKFNLEEPWVLSWAEWCSSLRIDEFGGGAVAVYKGETEWFNPSLLANKWVESKR